MPATRNDDALNANTRFNTVLALEGYIPVSRHDTDEARTACPEGFFMMEFCRLDNPAYRIITSFITSGDNKNGDYMQARFEEVPLTAAQRPAPGRLQRLMSIFSLAAKAPVQPEAAARRIMTIIEVMDLYDETGHFPLGTPAPREYRDLSTALHEDMCNKDHEKSAAFFIDPAKIANGYVGLRGHINPAKPLYKSIDKEGGGLDTDRLLDNTMLLMEHSRTVQLMIPTAEHASRGVYIKAGATYLDKQSDSVTQNVPLPVFATIRHELIAQHVKGQGLPAFASTPNCTLF